MVNLEYRDQEEILDWIDVNDLTASLLADSETNRLNNDLTISANTPIRHDRFIKDGTFTSIATKLTNSKLTDSPEINIAEIDIIEINFAESSILKDSSAKINPDKAGLAKISIGKVNPFQTTSPEATFIHTSSDEFSKTQVTLIKPTQIEVGVAEVSFPINTASDNFISPIATSKTLSREIFFSPSVLSEQFFSIHNSTSQSFNHLNSTAQNFWQSQPEIALEITDFCSV
jgi:hypothetical protein